MFHAGQGAFVESSGSETNRHGLAGGFPLFPWHGTTDGAIRDDLDGAIGKIQVNQDTAVFFRIPDPVAREQGMRAASGGGLLQQVGQVERGFDDQA